jgi:LPS-assembly protein
MTGFARRPIAAFVCCLFASAAAGQAVAAGKARTSGATTDNASADANVNLRVERKFNVLGKKKRPPPTGVGVDVPVDLTKGDKYPVFLTADRVEGRADEVSEASGNVEMRRAGTQMFADSAIYRPLDDEIEAAGHVRLLQEGVEVNSPEMRMHLTEQVGYADEAKYRIVRTARSRFYEPSKTIPSANAAASSGSISGAPMMLNIPNSYGLPTRVNEERVVEGNGEADRIDFEGENQMTLTNGTYSTCKPADPDWYLKASSMHLDLDEGDAVGRHARLWFEGVPILYAPVATFPVSNERRSGLLHPHFSLSTRNGLDLVAPYYWNMAPNYDMTLYPRYMSKRGTQLATDTRYLDYNYRGYLRFEYLPNDEIRQRDRWGYRIEHWHTLGQGLTGYINWNGVSDDYYWQDLSSRLLLTSQVQLPKQAMLSYTPAPWLQTNLQVLRYQTLQPDPTTTIAKPYFLEPQMNIIGYKADVLNTGSDLTLIGQVSRFTHQYPIPQQGQGDRLVFYPQLSMPIIGTAFQVTPKVGVHMSQYSLENRTDGGPTTLSRTLPTFSLDSTLFMEREDNWRGTGYVQTLEPRLYYVYIPYKDQSQFPVFDSGVADFNFAQIFSENRYTGYDRLNDANQLTAALTTRLLDGQTGAERFKAMFGQRYYFSPQRVTIAGETTRQADFSNAVAAVNGLIAPKTYGDAAWEYSYRESQTARFAAGVRYQPELGKVISGSYRYTNAMLTSQPSNVDQFDIAGQWPISGQWSVVGRQNWSLRDKKSLETIAGTEYNAGCWTLRVVAQRLGAVSGTANTTLFVQLELHDFASIGASPISLLRRTVPGYGKTNELPEGGSLLTTP